MLSKHFCPLALCAPCNVCKWKPCLSKITKKQQLHSFTCSTHTVHAPYPASWSSPHQALLTMNVPCVLCCSNVHFSFSVFLVWSVLEHFDRLWHVFFSPCTWCSQDKWNKWLIVLILHVSSKECTFYCLQRRGVLWPSDTRYSVLWFRFFFQQQYLQTTKYGFCCAYRIVIIDSK